jgi:hypothetical protein
LSNPSTINLLERIPQLRSPRCTAYAQSTARTFVLKLALSPRQARTNSILEVKRDNPFTSRSSADSVVFRRDGESNIISGPGFGIKRAYTRDNVHETMHLYCETRDRGNE